MRDILINILERLDRHSVQFKVDTRCELELSVISEWFVLFIIVQNAKNNRGCFKEPNIQ